MTKEHRKAWSTGHMDEALPQLKKQQPSAVGLTLEHLLKSVISTLR